MKEKFQKIIICLSIILVTGFLSISYAEQDLEPPTRDDFYLKGITTGVVFTDILKEKMGKVIKFEDAYPEGVHTRYYTYKEIQIDTLVSETKPEKEQVCGLTILSKTLKTRRAVTIGDDIELVFQKYGKMEPYAKTIYTYYYKKNCNLSIGFIKDKNNKIKDISIFGFSD